MKASTKRKKKSKKRHRKSLRRRGISHIKRHLKHRKYLLLFLLAILAVSLMPIICEMWEDIVSNQDKSQQLSCDYDGIDVSKYQGEIDWCTVALDSKIQFVYLKATEGASHVDRCYKENIRKARSAGLLVGSYHFFTSQRSPEDQFLNFRKYVKHEEQDLLPMVDVEHTGNRLAKRQQLQNNLAKFMELVKAEYGQYPLLYSQYKFYNDMLAPEFNHFFIFIARYSDSKPTLRGGGRYNIWQFTEKGHIDGIKENVDLNRFANGTTINDILLK